ncbi:hypothetical protein [Streptomyces sp. NRRL S-337]|uniref:hypothetical protein n=1 Tax=Streptomyces sp. NRRL S-337 TaxID=1463900 RepID=UPI0004C91D25|nr:hypothetical protein [Streptomyces sp. NRRL S-337]
MITAILGGLAGITLGVALIALVTWPRRITQRSLPPVPHARFYAVPDGTRYLACHNAGVCGHMQTPHVPADNGFWRCTTDGCGHIAEGDEK